MFDSPIWWYFQIYGLKDVVEIGAFSGSVYLFSRWLHADQHKPLLLYFYGYCAALTCAQLLQLTTISTALVGFAPVACIAFIVFHQETLQRNFVTLYTMTPARKAAAYEWVDLLIRNSLLAVSNNQPLSGIIQKRHVLNELLNCECSFNCKLSEGLFELLFASSAFDPRQMIWLNGDGTLVGINSVWKRSSIDTWLSQEVKEQEQWLQDALFFTAKTDALYFRVDPQTRTFTLITQGKLLEQVSAHGAVKTIKQYLGQVSSEPKEGEVNASRKKAISSEQPLS